MPDEQDRPLSEDPVVVPGAPGMPVGVTGEPPTSLQPAPPGPIVPEARMPGNAADMPGVVLNPGQGQTVAGPPQPVVDPLSQPDQSKSLLQQSPIAADQGHPSQHEPSSNKSGVTPHPQAANIPMTSAGQAELEYNRAAANEAEQRRLSAQTTLTATQAQADAQQKALLERQAAAQQSNDIRQGALRYADQADQESKARIKDIDAMAAQDPDSRNVFEKIAGAIAMGLGGYSAAINHTQNFAADIVQSSINRDVQRQKMRIENAKDSNAELNRLSQNKYGRQMTLADISDHHAIDLYNMAIDQAKVQYTKASAPAAQADALALIASLDKQRAQHVGDLAQRETQNGFERQKIGIEVAKANAAMSAGSNKGQATVKDVNELAAKLANDTSHPLLKSDGTPITNENERLQVAHARAYQQLNGVNTGADVGTISPKGEEEKAKDETRREGREEWITAYRQLQETNNPSLRDKLMRSLAMADSKMTGATRTPGEAALKSTLEIYPTFVGTVAGGALIGAGESAIRQRAQQLGITPEEMNPVPAGAKKI